MGLGSMTTLSAIAAEPYEHRGILHSEMAFVIETCRRLQIDAVIESGRARAQSTYMLAKYLPEAVVVSVEARPDHPDSIAGVERLHGLANVVLATGDGKAAVPHLIDMYADKRIAVLLDGPKGLAALELLDKCFRRSPLVLAGFIHDMRRLDHGKPSPFRLAAEAIYPANSKFTDDPDYVANFKWMDEQILAAGGPVGPAHEDEYGSYGPTIGVFFNQEVYVK